MSNIKRALAACALAGAALATAGTAAHAADAQSASAALPTPLGPVGEDNSTELPHLNTGALNGAPGQGVTQNVQGTVLGGLPLG
ncbi:hypothetical protein GTW43_13850 [Streptomyces sp. SID5785]|uniref:hypothetical protein n=1 Tax=Streptomyces sp. SID5785 TaxID=2690309 RepID=UPI0013614282|nr:hypothetical protein [Streptomyces sp. SID5785]MZD06167.1 hypothetical protein [Streptomyces sp. SID5785]